MIDPNILYSACPCGSGKKFKFCCYPVVRGILPPDPSLADVTGAVRQKSAAQRLSEAGKQPIILDLDLFHRLIGQGLQRLNQGDYAGAKSLFLEAREKFSMLPTPYNNLTLCALIQGDVEEAEKWTKEVVERFPLENPFGLAMYADLHYLRGDIAGALEILERAEQIVPPSVDQTARVCESLAHFEKHERIISYAEKSGFADDPEVAFYLGIAQANIGQKEAAMRTLRVALRCRQPDYVHKILDALIHDLRPTTIRGNWMYFTPQSFTLLASLLKHIKNGDQQKLNFAGELISEFVEVEVNGGELNAASAVEMLSEVVSKRSEQLLTVFKSSAAYPASVRKAATSAYRELFSQNNLGKKLRESSDQQFQQMVITEEEGTHVPLDPASEKIYFKAVRLAMDANSKRSSLEEAERLLRGLYKKLPDNPAVANNYASVLSRIGRPNEAVDIIRKCFAQHPEYVFGAANYLRQLMAGLLLDEAEAMITNYRLPQRIHPDAYACWMKAEYDYWQLVGDRKRARNVKKGLNLVMKQIGRNS